MIRCYITATGVANTDSSGYRETITIASLRAARTWLVAHAEQPLWQVLQGLLLRIRQVDMAVCVLVKGLPVLHSRAPRLGGSGLGAAVALGRAASQLRVSLIWSCGLSGCSAGVRYSLKRPGPGDPRASRAIAAT
jgi:hypothetical protein